MRDVTHKEEIHGSPCSNSNCNRIYYYEDLAAVHEDTCTTFEWIATEDTEQCTGTVTSTCPGKQKVYNYSCNCCDYNGWEKMECSNSAECKTSYSMDGTNHELTSGTCPECDGEGEVYEKCSLHNKSYEHYYCDDCDYVGTSFKHECEAGGCTCGNPLSMDLGDALEVDALELYDDIVSDLEEKQDNLGKLKTAAIDLNTQLKEGPASEIESLTKEKEELEDEIKELEELINSLESNPEIDALETQKAELESTKKGLEEEKTTLQETKADLNEQKIDLENDVDILKAELANLNTQLEELYKDANIQGSFGEYEEKLSEVEEKKAEINSKQEEINGVNEQIAEKEKRLLDLNANVENITKQIEEKQKVITEKQAEKAEKEKQIETKETTITEKVAEIAKIVEELNTNEESIGQSELKIAELQKNKAVLDGILLSKMESLYNVYKRVDKLASFATADLKTKTEEEIDKLTFAEAKSIFNSQIQKITSIEEKLTDFEYAYLLEKYSIPTVTTVQVEKTVQNEDGTTSKITEIKTEEIENPISKYFTELNSKTEEWTLSNYIVYINDFRKDDIYFSMATYCYLVRLNEGRTECVADEYVENEIEKLEYDGKDTFYLENAKNTYNEIIEAHEYKCSETVGTENVYNYASRMLKASGDINTYVCLPRLRTLNINENLIENIDIISELKELSKLYAYDNEIVDISKVNWSIMTKLRILDLGFNGISNIEPLEKIANIEELSLKKNLISGSFEFDISKLEKLAYLNVSENRINDIEELIKYLTYEARANGYADIANFLRNAGKLDIRFNNQILTMKIDKKFDINENRKVELPKIFKQIEEIDYANTSFGVNSIGGNITNDGKYVVLDTTVEGQRNTSVTITSTGSMASLGSGTTCTISYTVGTIIPVEVKVTPGTAEVTIGGSKQFTAEVTGDNVEYKEVKWEISGATSSKTTITADGLLQVGTDETAEKIKIKATSLYDETKVTEVEVTILQKTVKTVTVTPETATIKPGESIVIKATVEGENLEEKDKLVDWEVKVDTVKDENGEDVLPKLAEGTEAVKKDKELTLKVGNEETIKRFVIVAKSKYDETKVDEVIITVVEKSAEGSEDDSTIGLGYKVEEDYIVGVQTKTPVADFKEKLAKGYKVIVKQNGTEVTTGYMKTGMSVEIRDENNNTVKDENGNLLVYEVIVKGDINSDGVADALDSNLIKAIRNEVSTVLATQKRAADIDDNGNIDLIDSKLLLYHRAEVKDYCLDYTK